MIRPIDIKLNAAHPELPLVEATTFTGAPSSVFIRGVPKSVGNWSITAVNVAVTYPDNSTTTRAAVESAEGVWVATIPGTATSGRTAAGFKIMADGIDENGAAVTSYVLGFADFAVLSFFPVPAPGETYYLLRYFDTMPTTPKKGDVAVVGGVLKYYNGSAWEPFAALDDAVTRTSAKGVKSSGIWSAIWGALSALPTGFASLYDWCVSQLAGKVSKSGDTMTGGLTVSHLTVGSRADGSTVGENSVTEGYNVEASEYNSHAEGTGTVARNFSEHAQGVFNASHRAGPMPGESGNTLSSIGFGTADSARKNAVETMQDGKTFVFGLGGYDGTNPTNATDLAAAVNAKANRASNPTTGNLAALDASGNPMDSAIPAADVATNAEVAVADTKATKALADAASADNHAQAAADAAVTAHNAANQAIDAIPYAISTPIVIDTASSEVIEGETVYYGPATLADRTANVVQVTAATALDELRITFPAATSGKVRDFGLRVEIGTGSAALTAPALVPIAPTGETIKIENADGTIPELADGTATAKGVTLLYFSETASGVFVVRGEQVEEVTA